jgi:hypothetical protein
MALRSIPHAFVMSSSPGRPIAEAICAILDRGGKSKAHLWKTEFRGTDLFEESLMRPVLQYDYGIAVITPDDLTRISRPGVDADVREPRDNVIFELGMYRGALGRRYALPVVVTADGVKPSIPSDLDGFSDFVASVDRSKPLEGQLQAVCDDLQKHMSMYHVEPGLGLLPSSALAIGYVENFVKRVVKLLNENGNYKRKQFGDKTFHVEPTHWKLSIYVPPKLEKANGDSWKAELTLLGLVDAEVTPPGAPRGYPLWIDPRDKADRLIFYDMPTTLRSVYEAITQLMGRQTAPADRALAYERGLSDFYRALKVLIEQADLQNQVEIVDQAELYQRCGVALPKDDG